MAKFHLINNQQGPRGHADFMLAPGASGEFELDDDDVKMIKAGGILELSPAVKPVKKPVKAAEAIATSTILPVVLEVALLHDQLLEMGITADPNWDVARLQKEIDAALSA